MKAFQETTVWDVDFVMLNHVYFLSDSKDKMYGYVKHGTGELKEMSRPYKFKASGRKFTEVANVWGFVVDSEPVSQPVGKTYQVPGSRGAVYTVTDDHGSWTCTCPAAKWQKGACKHVTGLQTAP